MRDNEKELERVWDGSMEVDGERPGRERLSKSPLIMLSAVRKYA